MRYLDQIRTIVPHQITCAILVGIEWETSQFAKGILIKVVWSVWGGDELNFKVELGMGFGIVLDDRV